MEKKRVILITDGDRVAQEAVEAVGKQFGLRTISSSGGNPTPLSGQEIVERIKSTPWDPVLVMFDDRGKSWAYKGEQALHEVATHPDIQVLGAVAVASNTEGIEGVKPDVSIDDKGRLIDQAVDKMGKPLTERSFTNSINTPDPQVIYGDTVDVLNEVRPPVVVGTGDTGKMGRADDVKKGSPVTARAVEEILVRNGITPGSKEGK